MGPCPSHHFGPSLGPRNRTVGEGKVSGRRQTLVRGVKAKAP